MNYQKLTTIYIPTDLLEEFDIFVDAAINLLGDRLSRKDWSEKERKVVQWLEERKYRKNLTSSTK